MDKLRRPRQAMSDEIAILLRERNLRAAYDSRPPYQRNDYLSWIAQAAQPYTRKKRIEQMLLELEQGDVYMKMPWRVDRGV